MKKRFRKKFGTGEFYRPWFVVYAELKPMGEGEQADFVSRFIAEAEKLDMTCNGAIGDTELEVAIDTGRLATANEQRRDAFITAVQNWEEFAKFEASDLQ